MARFCATLWAVAMVLGFVACSDGSSRPADAAPEGAVPADGPAPNDGGAELPFPQFEEVTAAAGLSYDQGTPDDLSECPLDPGRCTSFLFTGGAAAGDFDGDGWPDLLVTRMVEGPILYRNLGNGTFIDVTDGSGIGTPGPTNGAAVGDVDDDGDLDLFLTTLAGTRNLLYINQGDGTFTEEAVARGVDLEDGRLHSGMSGCFGDYDRDGWLDLHTNEWDPTNVDPDVPTRTRLFHNRGSEAPGQFEDVTETAGVGRETVESGLGVSGFTSTFADMDGDRWPDLVFVADYGQTQLYWNDGDGTFTDGTASLGEGVPTDENGMGLAIADFDADGLPDWFVTSIYDDRFPCTGCDSWGTTGNRLYRNLGGRRFEDATDAFGVREGGWGWGAAAFDPDHDGDADLAMTNGYLLTGSSADPFFTDPTRMWRNDGTEPLVEIAAGVGIDHVASGKALVVLDYDRDGDLDLFIANNTAGESNTDGPTLYRNTGASGSYLRVRLRGAGAQAGGTNRHGVGALVEVVVREGEAPLTRELRGGCGFLSRSENVAHFGLGRANHVHEVRVWWPGSDSTTILTDVEANQVLEIAESL